MLDYILTSSLWAWGSATERQHLITEEEATAKRAKLLEDLQLLRAGCDAVTPVTAFPTLVP